LILGVEIAVFPMADRVKNVVLQKEVFNIEHGGP